MKVVTIASHTPQESYYCYAEMLASCRRWGHEPLVLGQNGSYGGLATKPILLRQAIESGQIPDEHIVFMDAFDVLFQDDPALAIARGMLDHSGKIVFNAERNLFPANPDDIHPESPTPWRYLNSGFAVGPTDVFLKCINMLPQDELRADRQREDKSWDTPNDQKLWQDLYCSGQAPIAIDSSCQIAQTMCDVKEDELDFSERKIRNKVTGETPVGIHLNGPKEFWLPRVLSKLGL